MESTIHIHNPHNGPVTFAKKAILLPWGRGQHPVEPGERVTETLPADWALPIDCPDIAQLAPFPPYEPPAGLVVIESPVELDVVARYWATRVDNTKDIACLYEDGTVVDFTLGLPPSPGMPPPEVPDCPITDGPGDLPLPPLVGIGVGQGVGSGFSVDVERVEPTRVNYTIREDGDDND